jgi:hypothetical protein
MLEAYLSLLELGYYEVQFAFEGLLDEHVWKRPVEGLLSVGEIAGHIAHWEALRLAGDVGLSDEAGAPPPDLAPHAVRSPLIDVRFSYYPRNLETPPSEQHLSMTSEQVYKELVRVHEEAVAIFKARNPALGSVPPGSPPNATYGELLKYLAFHIAYHTGQMYTVRHLLGEQTPDN